MKLSNMDSHHIMCRFLIQDSLSPHQPQQMSFGSVQTMSEGVRKDLVQAILDNQAHGTEEPEGGLTILQSYIIRLEGNGDMEIDVTESTTTASSVHDVPLSVAIDLLSVEDSAVSSTSSDQSRRSSGADIQHTNLSDETAANGDHPDILKWETIVVPSKVRRSSKSVLRYLHPSRLLRRKSLGCTYNLQKHDCHLHIVSRTPFTESNRIRLHSAFRACLCYTVCDSDDTECDSDDTESDRLWFD